MTSVLQQLAVSLGRRDEAHNRELAQEIVTASDTHAVVELVDALKNSDKAIQNDAIKVLYEAGKIDPDLIASYGDVFVELLGNRNNRLVWGGMEALAVVAQLRPGDLVPHLDPILQATEHGSVITRD